MCIAAPGKVIKVDGRTALVQYGTESRKALIGADPVSVGDYVMVQMGIIVKILTPDEAHSSIAAWEKNV